MRITTRKVPATDTAGEKVTARGEGHTRTLPWDYALNAEDMHMRAALALAETLPGYTSETTLRVVDGTRTGYVYSD